MKHRFQVGAGLAVAAVLATPWSAAAATSAVPLGRVSHHASGTPTDPVVAGCDFTETATTWTLSANCTATGTISVPDGVTLNGAGHTITVTGSFSGAAVQNAGATMSVEDLTIAGSGLTGVPPTGILLSNASGSLTNVHVTGMTAGTGVQAGFGVRVEATSPETVTVTGSSVTGFQKNGLVAFGAGATVNVSGSTFGPPDLLPGVIGQNSVLYQNGAGGTFSGNKVIGAPSNRDDAVSTGILLFGANNVTITGNTIGGAGVDMGVGVYDSTGVTASHNTLTKTPAPEGVKNYFGTTGVFIDETSEVTSTANTFSGWEDNIVGAHQEPYIVTTSPLPHGTEGRAYSVNLEALAEDPTSDLTWSVIHGSLPPGLKIKNDPGIVGTPTEAGTFHFTLQVHDGPDGATSTREFTLTIHPAVVDLHVTKTAYPDPAAAGQPITFTITVFNGGPDIAFGTLVHDGLPASFTGFTWTCSASRAPSACSSASGSGSIGDVPVAVAPDGTVVFRLRGTVPAGTSGHIVNTAHVTPEPGTVEEDKDCTQVECEASVDVPVGPALPLTGLDVMPEVAGGTGLIAMGGFLLMATGRRKR
jgi:uncharacterized repeat protein (TIGR01451 family)